MRMANFKIDRKCADGQVPTDLSVFRNRTEVDSVTVPVPQQEMHPFYSLSLNGECDEEGKV